MLHRWRVRFFLAAVLAVVLTVGVVSGQARSARAAGDPFAYPTNGQSLDYEGSYLIQAAPIAGATGYLIGIFQNGVLQYENLRDSNNLNQNVALNRGDPFRTRLLPNIATTLTVRGLVNGQWTGLQQIIVYLVPRHTQVKVLELRYFPLDSSGNLDSTETGICCYSLSGIRTQVNQLSSGTEQQLENSTVNFRLPSNGAYIDYAKVGQYEFQSKVPRSATFHQDPTHFFPDNFAILNPINICNWVDTQGVRDVWVWMYQAGNIVPIESNMAMGTNSAAFYNKSGYGDVSNSTQLKDLPVCAHTYTVYDFNYERDVAEAVHDYGHQRESLFGWADQGLAGQFQNPFGAGATGNRACGNVHNPPNSRQDYDYANPTAVPSICSDWHPGGAGTAAQVGCSAWGCSGAPQLQYLVWWAQRVPGPGNSLSLNGVRLRNWDELLADFDQGATAGRRLTE